MRLFWLAAVRTVQPSAALGSGRGSHPPKTCFSLARFVGWLLTCVLCVRVCVLVNAKGKVKEQMSANQVCKRLWRQQGSGSPPQMSLGIKFAAGRVRKLVFACICMAPAALLQSWSLWADHYEAGGRADASASGSGASTAELLQPACDRPLATFPAFSSMSADEMMMEGVFLCFLHSRTTAALAREPDASHTVSMIILTQKPLTPPHFYILTFFCMFFALCGTWACLCVDLLWIVSASEISGFSFRLDSFLKSHSDLFRLPHSLQREFQRVTDARGALRGTK